MTTVGFGDITPEKEQGRWYGLIIIILGSCINAGVIANITAMAHKVVISEDNAQHVMTCVEKYCVEKELPQSIREGCQRFFRTLHGDVNETKILSEFMPPPFLQRVCFHNYEDMIMSVPIFESIRHMKGLTTTLATMVKEQIIVGGDWITSGERAKRASFVTENFPSSVFMGTSTTELTHSTQLFLLAHCSQPSFKMHLASLGADNPSHEQWYFVKDGTVELKEPVILKEGENNSMVKMSKTKIIDFVVGGPLPTTKCFGEYSLFFPEKKPYNAKAVTNCALVSLHPEKFKSLELHYPTEFQRMKLFAKVSERRSN